MVESEDKGAGYEVFVSIYRCGNDLIKREIIVMYVDIFWTVLFPGSRRRKQAMSLHFLKDKNNRCKVSNRS